MIELNIAGLTPWKKVMQQTVESVEKKKNGQSDIVKTKWRVFNLAFSGGIEFGTNLVIGGRPRTGKSVLGSTMLYDICEINDTNKFIIIYYNWEMTNVQQGMRFLSSKTDIAVGDLKSNYSKLRDDEFKRVVQASGATNYPIYFIELSKRTKEIKELTEKILVLHPDIKIINIFDHTRLVTKTNEKSEEEKLTSLYMTCNDIKKLGCANIILTQLNRNLDKEIMQKYRAPTDADVFGADAAMQFADNMLLLHRPDIYGVDQWLTEDGQGYMQTLDMMWGEVAKAREGSEGTMLFKTNLKFNQITQL